MLDASRSTKPATTSSTLRAELERLSGDDPVLALLLRRKDRPTAEDYIATNWPTGDLPEEVDEEEMHIIELLRELATVP